jgi:colanic acid biosynthesis glycosyl transferase WcaI
MASELAEDLARHGHTVTVITGWPNHPAGVLYPGYTVRFREVINEPSGFRVVRCGHPIHRRDRLWRRLWNFLAFALSTFLNALACGRIDVVYNDSSPIFGVWTGWLLAKLKRAKVVYSIMDVYPEAALNAGLMREGAVYRILRWLDTFLCRRSDYVATLSEVMRRMILSRGINPERVGVLPFWVDPGKIRPVSRDNPWRKKQHIPSDTFVVLYAGTIGYISGADILLKAARILEGRGDILLLMVGEGPVKDSIQRQAVEENLSNMRFLPFQPAGELSDMQSTADVGLVTLLPGVGETSVPSKVLGYLAAGRPVVASVPEGTDTAGLIRTAGCGVMTEAQNPASLVGAILELADDPARRQDMGRRGREHLLAHYSRPVVVRQYEELFERVMRDRPFPKE